MLVCILLNQPYSLFEDRVLIEGLVEVAPIYDNPGEPTVLAAAEVVHSLIGLMVKSPA